MEFPWDTAQRICSWENTGREKRPFIQDAFPDLTAEERQFILSGFDAELWEQLFGPPETN